MKRRRGVQRENRWFFFQLQTFFSSSVRNIFHLFLIASFFFSLWTNERKIKITPESEWIPSKWDSVLLAALKHSTGIIIDLREKVRSAWVWKTFSSPHHNSLAWWATWGRRNIEKWRIFALSTASSWNFPTFPDVRFLLLCRMPPPRTGTFHTLNILSCLTRWFFCVHNARRKRRQRSGGEKWFNSRHSLALPTLWACSHLADSKFLSIEKMCRRNEDDFLVSPSLLLYFHIVHNGWLKIAAYNSNASKISPTHIAQACWLNQKNSKISLCFTFSLSSFSARRRRSLVYIFKNLKNIFTLSLG